MSNKRMRPTVLEASTYDFISSLPDESLQHILCFMTTREAIQTCVLSTRWHHIWKSVQCLEIKASEFTSKMGFVNFMDNLVLRRGCVPLDSLRMYTLYQHGSVSLNHHNANMWVGYALRRNVHELHICEHYSEYFDLDHSSFISSHLKILRLRNVTISDLFIEKLFSGCPALQDLVMIDCCVYATRFSSTSLKNLTFISHSPDNGDSVHDDYKDLVTDTPSLVSLHLECLPFLAPCLVNVSSVAKAYIRLDDMSFPCFDTKYNILSGLSNVTKLKLLNEEYDDEDEDEDDSFRSRQNEIEGLAWEQWMSYPQEETPDMSFSCERLKKVKIICVQDDKRVPAIVNAILANANSLPEIVIKPCAAPPRGGRVPGWSSPERRRGRRKRPPERTPPDDAFQLMQNEVLKRDLWRCRTFNNLKKLSVSDWCVDGELHTLIHLLRCSPILEKLTLHLGVIGGLAWEQWMSYPQSEMPDMSFICERLKKVKIICANDDKRVPPIVNAILVNANSLPEIAGDVRPTIVDVVGLLTDMRAPSSCGTHLSVAHARVPHHNSVTGATAASAWVPGHLDLAGVARRRAEVVGSGSGARSSGHLGAACGRAVVCRFGLLAGRRTPVRGAEEASPSDGCRTPVKNGGQREQGHSPPPRERDMSQSSRRMSVCDRISALPDELLHHVMTFLTAKEAVQTCVLSRRTWASVGYLNVDSCNFITVKHFKKFVDNLLLQRSCALLDMFCIHTSYDISDDSLDYSDIHPWVRHALRCNVKTLGILNYCDGKLLSVDGYPVPFTSLHLKNVYLCKFSIDNRFVEKLFSGCPELLHLELRHCAIKATMFCSATLKILTITAADRTQDDTEGFQHLVINMPNLICLHVEEIANRNLRLLDISSVESASVYLNRFSFGHSDVDCTILSALSNAARLHLMSSSIYEDHGAYAYDHHTNSANATADLDPTCEGTGTAVNCEKLRKIKIICPQGDRRVHIIDWTVGMAVCCICQCHLRFLHLYSKGILAADLSIDPAKGKEEEEPYDVAYSGKEDES
uniref:F-box domain-containing protein n=1 Tax=Oryza glumipatula TaxID=40148 RepID=A0A0E0AQU1_9ORYZ